mgnify:CR=1 FL=1
MWIKAIAGERTGNADRERGLEGEIEGALWIKTLKPTFT